MAKFADTYQDMKFVQTPSAQISWSHNVAILDKVKDANQHVWYICRLTYDRADGERFRGYFLFTEPRVVHLARPVIDKPYRIIMKYGKLDTYSPYQNHTRKITGRHSDTSNSSAWDGKGFAEFLRGGLPRFLGTGTYPIPRGGV